MSEPFTHYILQSRHFCGIPTYSVYIFEQSMCRLHRPGQEKNVTIDFWVYGENPKLVNGKNNQLQALAMVVMSDKVRASAVVSGSVGAGLAALNQQNGDIMNTLRDILLSKDAAPSFSEDAAPLLQQAILVNPLYAQIEAKIEDYDDQRIGKLISVAPAKVEMIPAEAVVQRQPELLPALMPIPPANPVVPIPEATPPDKSAQEALPLVAPVATQTALVAADLPETTVSTQTSDFPTALSTAASEPQKPLVADPLLALLNRTAIPAVPIPAVPSGERVPEAMSLVAPVVIQTAIASAASPEMTNTPHIGDSPTTLTDADQEPLVTDPLLALIHQTPPPGLRNICLAVPLTPKPVPPKRAENRPERRTYRRHPCAAASQAVLPASTCFSKGDCQCRLTWQPS